VQCDETPHRAQSAHCAYRTTSRRERQVTGRFAPSSVHPIGRIQRFLLIQLKPSMYFGAVRTVRCFVTPLLVWSMKESVVEHRFVHPIVVGFDSTWDCHFIHLKVMDGWTIQHAVKVPPFCMTLVRWNGELSTTRERIVYGTNSAQYWLHVFHFWANLEYFYIIYHFSIINIT